MAKVSSLRGMQDARDKDMFHLSNSNYLRYNGHVQISAGGKGGKKERKGCTKGKLEAVMRNSSFGSSIISSANMTVSSLNNSHGNHFIRSSHQVKPSQADQDDPYTFTEAEPQLTSYYPSSSCSGISAKKPVSRTTDATITRRASTESGSSRRSSVESSSTSRRVNADASSRRSVDTPSKSLPKSRTVEPNSSKMNKLQAEFARSKVMGKRRKVDQPPAPKWESTQKKVCSRVLIPNRKAPRKTTWQREKKARHELLERIEEAKNKWETTYQDIFSLGPDTSETEDDSQDSQAVYERYWFDSYNRPETREDRVSSTRAELRRELSQTIRGVALADPSPTYLLRSIISAAKVLPNATSHILDPSPPPPTPTAKYINKISKRGMFLLKGEKCSYWEGCSEQALPCTRHCSRHIMYNVDQRLFSRCTAKSMDNTQCNVPVIDVTHHLPLCPLHAHQHERYNILTNEAKNKKIAKKNRIVGISRSNKRSQKKKKKVNSSGAGSAEEMELSRTLATLRPDMDIEVTHGLVDGHTTIHIPEPPEDSLGPADHIAEPSTLQPHLQEPAPPPSIAPTTSLVEVDGEVPEEVLEIASLDPVELAHQATRLLEEHDFTNVLNQIPPDAFNDLFAGFAAEDKNGGYEPTREETEELDRALEAVDNDVRSLEERMTRQLPSLLPLVDSLLDDPHLSFATTDIQPSS